MKLKKNKNKIKCDLGHDTRMNKPNVKWSNKNKNLKLKKKAKKKTW
jgi:hypothetical protein